MWESPRRLLFIATNLVAALRRRRVAPIKLGETSSVFLQPRVISFSSPNEPCSEFCGVESTAEFAQKKTLRMLREGWGVNQLIRDRRRLSYSIFDRKLRQIRNHADVN